MISKHNKTPISNRRLSKMQTRGQNQFLSNKTKNDCKSDSKMRAKTNKGTKKLNKIQYRLDTMLPTITYEKPTRTQGLNTPTTRSAKCLRETYASAH